MSEGKTDARVRTTTAIGAPARKGSPFVLPYGGISPRFSGSLIAGAHAAVLGRATLGRNAWLGVSSVIRADGHFVRVGDDFRLGSRSTIHIAHDLYPTIIGDRVSVGENAVIHACTLGDNIVVGDGAVILDGSTVGSGVAIEPHAIVFPRSELGSGKLYAGMPARPVRNLEPGELQKIAAEMQRRKGADDIAGSAIAESDLDRCLFIAATARLRGRIVAAENSSIWFGCDLDANDGEIAIGRNSNIQDNTLIRCGPRRRFTIGEDSTIGHNVTLGDCDIGSRSLIGIGSVVASGTIVEDDVFLAAGAETTPGQVLEGGFLWGKRPAVKLAPLDASKRALIATTIEHYCGYAAAFADAQRN